MKKPAVLILASLFSLLFVNCKKKMKKNIKEDFCLNQSYFDGKMRFGLTQNGQNEYNDQLQFEMTTSFRKDQLAFNKYQTARQDKGYYPEEKTVMKL
jgi:hypothetical protein